MVTCRRQPGATIVIGASVAGVGRDVVVEIFCQALEPDLELMDGDLEACKASNY